MTQPRTLLEENRMLRDQVSNLQQTLRDLRSAPAEQLARLAMRYRLTPSQCRILVKLSDGQFHQFREIAANCCRTSTGGSIKVQISKIRKLVPVEGRHCFGYRLPAHSLAEVKAVMAGDVQ